MAKRRRYYRGGVGTLVGLILVAFIVLLLVNVVSHSRNSQPSPTPTITVPLPTTIHRVAGEYIGLSSGDFSFDLSRADKVEKQSAAIAIQKKDIATAYADLQHATLVDSNDAEARIYLENLKVMESGSPYITIVVATMFGDGLPGSSNLQGAYIAQIQYNEVGELPNGYLVKMIIANAGSNSVNADKVAQQIVAVATQEKIIGVMGWPYSSYTLNAIKTLGQAHISMVSPSASSNFLSNYSPYFFRVVPPDAEQATAAVRYAKKSLPHRSVVLFKDIQNPYSTSLGSSFEAQFAQGGGGDLKIVQYSVSHPQDLRHLVQQILPSKPDLIYFAGYNDGVSVVLATIPKDSNIQVLGGDALYGLNGYTAAAMVNLPKLRFTGFAYPDVWNFLGLDKKSPNFFRDYVQIYDPLNQHRDHPYGYRRTDSDTMVSYDASLVLLNAAILSVPTWGTDREHLKNAIGGTDIQGVTGEIRIDSVSGNPVDKAICVLSFDNLRRIHLVSVEGTFLKR